MAEEFYTGLLHDIKINSAFNTIKFYDKIIDFTAKTHFIKLNEDESLAIVDCYRELVNKTEEMSKDQALLIRQIEKKVETLISEEFKGRAFFTKIFQRSLKDGKTYLKLNQNENYEKEYQDLRTKWSNSNLRGKVAEKDWENNLKLIANELAFFKNLKCTTAKEMMNMMVTSLRTYLDLEVMLEYGRRNKLEGKENELSENYICLREWVNVSIIHEYRCIIYKNHFICMSQYKRYYLVHLESEEQREAIKKAVVTFWTEKIKEPLSFYETYNVDIAICEDGSPLVIELHNIQSCDTFCMTEECDKVRKGEIDITDWNEDKIVFKYNSQTEEGKDESIKELQKYITELDQEEHVTYDQLLDRKDSKRSCSIY